MLLAVLAWIAFQTTAAPDDLLAESPTDDLLATASMVIPPDCPDEGQLLLPAALPGLEVRIEGERIEAVSRPGECPDEADERRIDLGDQLAD